MYAMALNGDRPSPETRARLAALTGPDVEAVVLKHAAVVLQTRTYPLAAPKGLSGMADFVVLLGEDARPQGVEFVSGEQKLRPLGDAIRKVQFGEPLPDVAPAKILRRGTVSCGATGCSFILFPSGHAQAVK